MDTKVVKDFENFLSKLGSEGFDSISDDAEYVLISNAKDPRLAGVGSLISLPLPVIVAQKPGSMIVSDPDISEFLPQESSASNRNRIHMNSYDASQGSPLKMQEYADLSDNETHVASEVN